MDWLAERRRMFGGSKINVDSFEEFISKSSIVSTFYVYSPNVTIPVDTENCTKYVITLGIRGSVGTIVNTGFMAIVRITDGIVTELFSCKETFLWGKYIIPTASSTSAILVSYNCLGIVIDPLNLNIVSCDELLRSTIHIRFDSNDGSSSTACIQNPFEKGAKYVIAAWETSRSHSNYSGAKIVRVDSNISFTTLASFGKTANLLTGVSTDNSNRGFWHVYCADADYGGIANDKYAEHIVALSFDE